MFAIIDNFGQHHYDCFHFLRKSCMMFRFFARTFSEITSNQFSYYNCFFVLFLYIPKRKINFVFADRVTANMGMPQKGTEGRYVNEAEVQPLVTKGISYFGNRICPFAQRAWWTAKEVCPQQPMFDFYIFALVNCLPMDQLYLFISIKLSCCHFYFIFYILYSSDC